MLTRINTTLLTTKEEPEDHYVAWLIAHDKIERYPTISEDFKKHRYRLRHYMGGDPVWADLFVPVIWDTDIFNMPETIKNIDAVLEEMNDEINQHFDVIQEQLDELKEKEVELNIEIGGRNYVRSSDFDNTVFENITIYTGTSDIGTGVWAVESSRLDISHDETEHTVTFKSTATTNSRYGFMYIADVEPNTDYILSFISDGNYNISISDGNWKPSSDINTYDWNDTIELSEFSEMFGRFWTSFNSGEHIKLMIYFFSRSSDENPSTIGFVKLEKGTQPTDWTPAPEDVNLVEEKITEAINDIEIGGRNLIRDSKDVRSMYIPADATQYNQYDFDTTIQLPIVGHEFYITAQYKVDGWTNDFAPIDTFVLGQAGADGYNDSTDALSRRIVFADYKQINETTRLYYGAVKILTSDTDILNVLSTPIVKAIASQQQIDTGVRYDFEAYEFKVEAGNILTGWSPAPEDIQDIALEQVSNIQMWLESASDYNVPNTGDSKYVFIQALYKGLPTYDVSFTCIGCEVDDSYDIVKMGNTIVAKFNITSNSNQSITATITNDTSISSNIYWGDVTFSWATGNATETIVANDPDSTATVIDGAGTLTLTID